MNVKRYKPNATVYFFSEAGNQIVTALESDSFNNKTGNLIDNDVVSIQTGRDMGADAPTFSVVLTRRRKWHKYVLPNDLVIIDMVRPPEYNRTVMVGLADDIRKTFSMDPNGIPQRSITISGRGMAKAFIQFDIGQVPESDIVDPNVGWIVSNGVTFAGANADSIIRSVWEMIAKKYVNYRFANNKSLFDIAQVKLSARPNARMKDDLGLINWQGSLWQFFKEVADEPFNEIFWETDSKVPILTVRPTPFNKDEWDALPVTKITDEEIVAEDIGRSDVETYTLFSVGMKSYFSSEDSFKTTGIKPYWYRPYKDRYGLRRLHVETLYAAWAGGDSEDPNLAGQELLSYMKDLYNWNVKNNFFFNGTLVVRGSNRFKIGTRIQYYSEEEGETLEFYVRAVSHNFVNFGSWITVLKVIRGCKYEDRFTTPIDSYEEYNGIGWDVYDPDGRGTVRTQVFVGSYVASDEYKNTADKIIAGARAIMNSGTVKYKFGGPGVEKGAADCSQFTQYVFKKFADLEIGRSTGEQVLKGVTITDKSQLIKGDLVFFTGTYNSSHVYGVSHVGIYIENGKFINLSSSGINEASITDGGYWTSHYFRGQRVIQSVVDKVVGKTLVDVVATAYGGSKLNGGAGTWKTYTGVRPTEGRTIAVDPDVIPLGSQVIISCPSYPSIDGKTYIAEDIGSAIKDNRIDIYFEDEDDPEGARKIMLDFGRRTVKLTVVETTKK